MKKLLTRGLLLLLTAALLLCISACGSPTLEEYAAEDVWLDTVLAELKSGYADRGLPCTSEISGDTLSLRFTYAGMAGEAVQQAVESLFSGGESEHMFSSLARTLRSECSNDSVTVTVEVLDQSGLLLFENSYTAP